MSFATLAPGAAARLTAKMAVTLGDSCTLVAPGAAGGAQDRRTGIGADTPPGAVYSGPCAVRDGREQWTREQAETDVEGDASVRLPLGSVPAGTDLAQLTGTFNFNGMAMPGNVTSVERRELQDYLVVEWTGPGSPLP